MEKGTLTKKINRPDMWMPCMFPKMTIIMLEQSQ